MLQVVCPACSNRDSSDLGLAVEEALQLLGVADAAVLVKVGLAAACKQLTAIAAGHTGRPEATMP
jgi:hypothetical protein